MLETVAVATATILLVIATFAVTVTLISRRWERTVDLLGASRAELAQARAAEQTAVGLRARAAAARDQLVGQFTIADAQQHLIAAHAAVSRDTADDLRADTDTIRAQAEQVTLDLDELTDGITHAASEMTDAEQARADAARAVTDAAAELNQLHAELTAARAAFAHATSRRDFSTTEAQRLHAEHAQIAAELEQATVELDHLYQDLDLIEWEITPLTSDVRERARTTATLAADTHRVRLLTEQTRRALNDAQQTHERLTGERAELDAQHQQALDAHQAATQQLQTVREEHARVVEELTAVRADLDVRHAAFATVQAETDVARAAADAEQQQLDRAREARDTARGELTDLRRDKRNADARHGRAQGAASRLRDKIESVLESTVEAEVALAQATHQIGVVAATAEQVGADTAEARAAAAAAEQVASAASQIGELAAGLQEILTTEPDGDTPRTEQLAAVRAVAEQVIDDARSTLADVGVELDTSRETAADPQPVVVTSPTDYLPDPEPDPEPDPDPDPAPEPDVRAALPVDEEPTPQPHVRAPADNTDGHVTDPPAAMDTVPTGERPPPELTADPAEPAAGDEPASTPFADYDPHGSGNGQTTAPPDPLTPPTGTDLLDGLFDDDPDDPDDDPDEQADTQMHVVVLDD